MQTRTGLTPREAAQRLKVSLGRVYHLIWGGQLPAIRKDGRWQITEAGITERLKAREDSNGTAVR
jgi:excisionase family DNA binding protein